MYSFSYDLAGRVQTVAEPYNLSLTFTYDAAGERTQVADNFGGVTTSVYDDAGRLTSRQLGGTVAAPARVDYGYSNRNELTDVTRYSDLAGTNKIGTTSYSYDDAGRMTNIQHNNASGGGLANYTYTYDAADRLATKIDNGVTTPYNYYDDNQLQQDGAATYSYDATGNRTNPGYATTTGNRITSDGTWAYSYDDEGNTTKKSKGASAETWTYGYDNANRMIWSEQRSSDGGPLLARVEYTYDVFGNRIRRVQYDGNMVVVSDERYGQDGWDTAKPDAIGNEDFEVYVDLDGGNNITARRIYGAGFDQPAARIDANGVAWYLTDRQGSVRAVTDNTGAITGTRDYSAFGTVTASGGAGLDRMGYTGGQLDPTTGQTALGQRWLENGRWTTEDPIHADAANQYRYTGNSPTNATDPSGYEVSIKPVPGQPHASAAYMDKVAIGRLVVLNGVSFVVRPVNGEPRYVPYDYLVANEDSITGRDHIETRRNLTQVFSGDRSLSRQAFHFITQDFKAGNRYTGYNNDRHALGWTFGKDAADLTIQLGKKVAEEGVFQLAGMAVGGPLTKITEVLAAKGFRYAYDAGRKVWIIVNNKTAKRAGAADLAAIREALKEKVAAGELRDFVGCFPANTLIAMDGDLRPIQTVRPRDRVWAFNHSVGEWQLRYVAETFERVYSGGVVTISVASEEIEATAHHPFWVVEGDNLAARPIAEHIPETPTDSQVPGRWVDAIDVRAGDTLLLFGDKRCPVQAVRVGDETLVVYNIRVDDLQCYAVGKSQVLVHNNSKAPAGASGRFSHTPIDQGNPAIAELRRRYLGETPRRGSPTYRAVVERMQREGHIRLNQTTGQFELKGQINGAEVWRPLSSRQINMGHRIDAVQWWNETGRFYGARSPQAREFMLNSDNYILQFEEVNKSLGATLRHQGNEYLRPPIASLKVVK